MAGEYATRDELNGLGMRVTDLEKNHESCQGRISERVKSLESWTRDQELKIDENQRESRAALALLKDDHSGRIQTVRDNHNELRIEVTGIPDKVAKQINTRMTWQMAVMTAVIAALTLILGLSGGS